MNVHSLWIVMYCTCNLFCTTTPAGYGGSALATPLQQSRLPYTSQFEEPTLWVASGVWMYRDCCVVWLEFKHHLLYFVVCCFQFSMFFTWCIWYLKLSGLKSVFALRIQPCLTFFCELIAAFLACKWVVVLAFLIFWLRSWLMDSPSGTGQKISCVERVGIASRNNELVQSPN